MFIFKHSKKIYSMRYLSMFLGTNFCQSWFNIYKQTCIFTSIICSRSRFLDLIYVNAENLNSKRYEEPNSNKDLTAFSLNSRYWFRCEIQKHDNSFSTKEALLIKSFLKSIRLSCSTVVRNYEGVNYPFIFFRIQ